MAERHAETDHARPCRAAHPRALNLEYIESCFKDVEFFLGINSGVQFAEGESEPRQVQNVMSRWPLLSRWLEGFLCHRC